MIARSGRIRTIFFDCDSTLVSVEGIDELAQRAGVGAELARLTEAAMNGAVPLEDVYGRRLEAVQPDARALEWLATRYRETLVTGAREVVAALTALGREVHVVSGGLLPAVMAVALELGIPPERVHAVPVALDLAGRYDGYDRGSPLARTGGKALVCRRVLTSSPRPAVLVGDGHTDLEAASVCDAIIGYGGVVAREEVRRRADRFIEDPTLYPLLTELLDSAELDRLVELGHRETVQRAIAAAGGHSA